MASNFICPSCKNTVKVGRLHAKYTCPCCGAGMLITKQEKLLGRKIPKRNFLKRSFNESKNFQKRVEK